MTICPNCGYNSDFVKKPEHDKYIWLRATKDFDETPQCAFKCRKGEVVRVLREDWNPRRRLYILTVGHGTVFEIEGLEECQSS